MDLRARRHSLAQRARRVAMRLADPMLGPPYALTIHDEQRFVYARVPKAATHSMGAWLGGTFRPPPRWYDSAFLPRSLEGWFVFTVVRNPWARVAATWKEKARGSSAPVPFYAPWADRPFAEFVDHLATIDLDEAERHVRRQSALLPLDRVDFAARLEQINDDIEVIADRLGVSTRAFQKLNAAPTHLRGDHRELYDDRTAGLVGELYRREIEAFRYDFDGPVTR